MGSTMKPTIFDNRVASALKSWHHKAKKNAKDGKHSSSVTPFSSRPATPEHGSSPIHLLHNYQQRSLDSLPVTPRGGNVETENWAVPVGSQSLSRRGRSRDGDEDDSHWNRDADITEPDGPGAVEIQMAGAQHSVDISSSEFTFGKSG